MEKFRKIATLLLALTLSLGLAAPAFAAGGETQRGVLTYTEAIAPQYEDANLFNSDDGLAPVKKDGKWGYINEKNEVVIGFQYDYAWRFNEGYAVVAKALSTTPEASDYITYTYYMEAELGFIDRDNHYTPFAYPDSDPLTVTFYDAVFDYGDGDTEESRFMPEDEVWLFHNGMVLLREVDPESGYPERHICKADGTIVVPRDGTSYLGDPTGPLNEGLIPVQCGELAGYIDANGNVRHLFDEEYFGPEIPTGWGTAQSLRSIYYVTTFNQGLAAAWQETYDAATDEITDRVGFIDRSFNWVIQPQYTDWYWFDTYRTCQIFGQTGLASVADANGKWGAINKKGETVIPFQYEQLGVVRSGLLMFKQGEKYGYLDAETYQVAIPAQYEAASAFNGDLGLAAVYDGNKAFLIDKSGKAVPGADVLDPSTYFIRQDDGNFQTYTPDTYVVIEKDGKYGYGKIDYLPELPSADKTSSWAYNEVVEAIEEELVPVYLQNLYRQDITRSEFCDLIVQTVSEALGKDVETLVLERTGKTLTALRQEYKFNDTTSVNVAAAYALGIVKGDSDTTFNPYGRITRQEAAAMLARAARLLGLKAGTGVSFNDADTFAGWAKDDISYVSGLVDPVSSNRVMNGVSNDRFDPAGSYTREQAIMTALRLFRCAA